MPAHKQLNLTLRVWRQPDAGSRGEFRDYKLYSVSPEMSFLEMLDVLNEQLLEEGEEPVAFDHDCREGICGTCGVVINGQPHGPMQGTTTCQLHMRNFEDGDLIVIEPWRASAFPVVRDLVVNRSAFDRIIQAGGYVSVRTGQAPDGNAILVPSPDQAGAMDAAACIGCGACVAACKNASAMLFTAAKVSHLAQLPQGEPERKQRALQMIATHDEEGFGACTNTYECEAACPAEISVSHIARLNREYSKAMLTARQ
ncbi:MAG: succinate dehydrogenase/fumarate reductase iron-sulfur subunit [Planctomycetota bacterium]|nr:MAG: succinate dehydrogenase/fumarate reductase iron-sulfur subunit [Planctomycetota bacterium]REJ97270.1 MAG: succinate dehydrogenase/fumarate reductase iron-sulfur subunit [Planctomycetota bacterium]REK20719.1 MAG: succinate dehydrogenase/fumarate reductase iron-sulfur subunit [Planctomycetota bacterium]REK38098.1 MAG: succinate dehydrogenase/fumarate reductase iron-sulfur subunit [Planctomycetota bacterium]